MRFFLNFFLLLFFIIFLLVGVNYSINRFAFQASNEHQIYDQEFKIITIDIKIKDNLPIRKDLNLKTKYYFRLLDKKISLINLINKITFSLTDFDILNQDLTLEIDCNYTLLLSAKRKAIQFFNRNTIDYQTLVNIGLKVEDAEEITNIFHDLKIPGTDLETKLKAVLPSSKRKYLKIIKTFVIF